MVDLIDLLFVASAIDRGRKDESRFKRCRIGNLPLLCYKLMAFLHHNPIVITLALKLQFFHRDRFESHYYLHLKWMHWHFECIGIGDACVADMLFRFIDIGSKTIF